MTDIRALAEKRCGKPSHATKLELRFGRKGSVKVRLADGVWVDYETGQGGRLRADDAAPAPRKTRAQIEQAERAEAERREANRRKAHDFWTACAPAEGSIVEDYLRSRGVMLPPGAPIRYQPRAYHYKADRTFPAMVAAIQHNQTGAFLGVHRTFLRPDGRGKAPVLDAKLVMGLQLHGAVRLCPAGQPWHGFAEGIETALSGRLISGLPVWALLNAGNISGFSGAQGIDKAVLFADRDDPGYRAAKAMVANFRPGQAKAVAPKLPGLDWNDEVKRLRVMTAAYDGSDGFVPGCADYAVVA